MDYKGLFVLLEGNDDERFFEKIFTPELSKEYDDIRFYQYAQQTSKKIENFVNSILAMNADYIIVTDIDKSPCVAEKKEGLTERKIKNKKVSISDIIVVIKEIESWYIAGLDAASLKELKINLSGNTDSLTKEQFDRLIPGKFVSRIDFMQEILKYFKKETAKQKNQSFNYFVKKFKI